MPSVNAPKPRVERRAPSAVFSSDSSNWGRCEWTASATAAVHCPWAAARDDSCRSRIGIASEARDRIDPSASAQKALLKFSLT